MTPEQFCYWLQGRVELLPNTPISEHELDVIKDHLALVFNKVTPDRTVTWIPYCPPDRGQIPRSPFEIRPTQVTC